MARLCGWCKNPSLEAECRNCAKPIYLCHNSVDCDWAHREGGFHCESYSTNPSAAFPVTATIRPSSKDDIPKTVDIKQYPVAVLATNKRNGKTYSEMLGIKNYIVVTKREEIEGLHVRAVVITPAYYEQLEEHRWRLGLLTEATSRMGRLTNAPRG